VDFDADGDDDGGGGVKSLIGRLTVVRLQMMFLTQSAGCYLDRPATRKFQASVHVFEDLDLAGWGGRDNDDDGGDDDDTVAGHRFVTVWWTLIMRVPMMESARADYGAAVVVVVVDAAAAAVAVADGECVGDGTPGGPPATVIAEMLFAGLVDGAVGAGYG